MTARRQQTSEIALNQKHLDQVATEQAFVFQRQQAADTRAHLDRVAAATEADGEARRITYLYTKATDQLGSDKAPVRLAGLYALERVAQDNPGQRQTIVNGRAQFAGVARFDSAMAFARQEPEDACWVRLDVPDEVASNRSWPAGSAEVRLAERPAPDANGEWVG